VSPRSVDLDRRTFLALIGAGAGVSALGAGCASASRGARASWVDASGRATWIPPPMPLPLCGDGGCAADDALRLARFEVQDELVLPAGFRYERVATWGERFGGVRFGTSADFTALVPVEGKPGEYFLVVNHEAVDARPWLQGYAAACGEALPELRWVDEVPSAASRHALERIARAALDDLGVSVLHVRQERDGSVRVLRDSPRHARISGLHPTTPTFGNCSGGLTPWGSVLTAEENYQDYVQDAVDARGEFLADASYAIGIPQGDPVTGLPGYLRGIGSACDPPLDGRDFGWICEVDPARGSLRKLQRLGRLRHENAAVACHAGRALAVYQGDDRRGGHVWRYESAALARDPRDARNSLLFDAGTLFVARFAADGSGSWIPLAPATPLARPRPEACSGGALWLPDRRVARAGDVPAGTRVRVVDGTQGHSGRSVGEWIADVELACGRPFAELTLGDLVWPPAAEPELAGDALAAHRRRVIELEAFAMANAVGATPTGRPEDVELHPADGSLYIAFSDAASGGDGSPDLCVLPDALGECSRRYGAIVRLVDDDAPEGRARSFRWSRFVDSGELCEGGGGFGCPDNLAFDADGNLWMTCDLTSGLQHCDVDRGEGSRPGSDAFVGVFGSNALFYVPTRGPDAGKPVCFAVAPPESELTGPSFTPDGRALILSVQHPGEIHGARRADPEGSAERRLTVAARDGTLFEQLRSVPLGSNWPTGLRGEAPRSAVVCITRAGP
jgi:secreted PhoX family phosphatase